MLGLACIRRRTKQKQLDHADVVKRAERNKKRPKPLTERLTQLWNLPNVEPIAEGSGLAFISTD
jgi:hypothetical protein